MLSLVRHGRRVGKLAGVAWTLGRAARWRPPWSLDGAVVQVENTRHCNFRCAYCPTHSPDAESAPRRGHMSLDTLTGILDQHPDARLLVLQGQGEPLLDPTLFDKIALARARGLVTQVVSNGSLLDDARIERLAQAGPDVLLVSLDAVSAARNEAARKGLRHDRVTDGIARLVAARRRGRRRFVVGILAVAHGEPAETAAALAGFNRLGIDLLLYKQLNGAYQTRIRGYRGTRRPAIPRPVRRLLDYPLLHQRLATVRPCAQLRFDLPYYLWHGARTACCVLSDERYAVPEFQRLPLLARHDRGAAPDECARCSYYGGAA